MPGKCQFREYWLTKEGNEDIAKWLRPVNDDKFKANCTFCKTMFNVSFTGFNSVKCHEKSKTHQAVCLALLTGKQTKLCFKSATSNKEQTLCAANSIASASSTSIATPKESPLSKYLLKDDVTKAEIIWAINKVISHSSDRGASVTSGLFPLMFTDSFIARDFHMLKDKLGYFISYGLGPFFQNSLSPELKKCDYFCVSLDESLNKVAQKGQMDVVVRYWDAVSEEVSTRYLTSAFLGHVTALDLKESFISSILELGLSLDKVMQIALDGPNVNIKFLNDFRSFMKEDSIENDKEIIDVGTCSLHKVHGSYKTAHKKSEWNINQFLRSLYYLFKDFPPRRADYMRYSGSSVFPKKMCSIRWVENSGVIERALKMIPHLKKYIAGVKSTPPDTKNFHIVAKFLNDELLPAKLLFLQSIAFELEGFLTCFQSNNPLLPFMYSEMYSMAHSIASRFLKKEVISSVKNAAQLISIDVLKKENHVNIKAVDIGFGAKDACKRAKKELDVITFQRDCRDFLISIYTKLVDKKSPLHNKMVRGASCLSPRIMLCPSIRGSRITAALEELLSKNYIAPLEADIIKKVYFKLCDDTDVQEKLKLFNFMTDKLDVLMKSICARNSEENLKFFKFSKIILTLFHGNAAVERGFSVNKECLVENLHENSLIAQRSIYSAVQSHGGLENVNISKEMILSVRNASSKRKEALKVKQSQQQKEECERKHAVQKVKELETRKRKLLELAKEETNAIETEINAAKKLLKQA